MSLHLLNVEREIAQRFFGAQLVAAFTLVLLLMVALWVVYLFQRNAGIVDLGWGTGFVLTTRASVRTGKACPPSVLFLTLFVFQGVLVIALSMSFFIVSLNSTEVWSQWEFWGVAIWALGVIGEAWADFQLKTFRDNPANAGKVCRQGWWRFSRHPNYFFEMLVWVGFCVFALSYPGKILRLCLYL